VGRTIAEAAERWAAMALIQNAADTFDAADAVMFSNENALQVVSRANLHPHYLRLSRAVEALKMEVFERDSSAAAGPA
jgi:hypothetical protein